MLAEFQTTTFANPAIRSAWYISDDVGGSPAARTVTVAATGAGQMGVIVADVLTADVSGSLAQAAVAGEDLANGDPSCTFGSTPGASNITLLGASFGGGSAATKPASFASIANAVSSTARINAAAYDITSASIGPNQYTSLNPRAIIIGIELAPASSSNKTLAAAAGSYALTGTAATPEFGRVVAANAGSYALSGSAATLRRSLPLVAGAGSYSLTGATASPLHSWKAAAGAGSYSLSGMAATLLVGKVVVAAAGAYDLTGSVASLLIARKLSAAVGSYALTGANANLIYSGVIPPPASEYRHSGQMAAMGRMMNR
ncbi:hypothetical protein [Mesorhizobium sp. B2-1-2]|uniref:hypothetical protein n=1 Tax=Mesorhizobium sp. B2-1-2 TaxID=2589973 RepID=UPI00112A9DBC|nr:hypothetical protein [Mesorhizobium sp. B2-1-2]TPN11714.1 hypothetical protein FJ971_09920 [Mesorhizobium sp. B2-1-2]